MNRPFIVAIAGGTASGKSTLAELLAEKLSAPTISHDCYYKTVPPEIANHPNRVEIYNYDHPDSLDSALLVKHLEELRAERPVRIPAYDYATSCAVPDVTEVSPSRFIIVDGILILSVPELRPLFDFSIFVEAPDDVRLIRRIRRDTVFRGQSLEYILTQYLAMVKPMHDRFVAPSGDYADLILDGTGNLQELVTDSYDNIRLRYGRLV